MLLQVLLKAKLELASAATIKQSLGLPSIHQNFRNWRPEAERFDPARDGPLFDWGTEFLDDLDAVWCI